ncbi:membrane protease YdiL (CAAX protease family) [Peribacillus deserti]|uniref:Membrane protease YdiL (CAAX protease family) n=1 Tax=Peribacillus deserti TaxID=673318 RepID=A0ABS2QNI7_9BACI|nr:CPBP family intramembrane glutamic endopeptidase [Peribacillus deserti]MBM7694730.1 membrane protease YdiL (CAAX protease family) [Peribacillus deserti]
MKNKQAEIIKTLSDRELVFHLLLTQFLLVVLSVGLGIVLFDNWSEFESLFTLNDSRIWTIGLPAGLIVVGLDLLLMKLVPESLYDDGGINERIFKSLSVPMLIIIPLLIAVCEELLFRGVIQTHTGLVWASIIFALVHYRYLFKWYLLVNMIVLSFLIGFIFSWTGNLMVSIMVHFIIDFLLGLIIKYRHQ